MKKLFLVSITLLAFIFTGCANGPSFSPEMGAALVRVTVGVGGAAALKNNPKYVPAAQAISAGINVALSTSSTITLDGINQYIAQAAGAKGVPPADIGLFTALADTIYTTYVAQFKTTVISSTDPTALLYVNAFKDGLNDAIIISVAATALPPK